MCQSAVADQCAQPTVGLGHSQARHGNQRVTGTAMTEVGHGADRGKSLFPGCVARCHNDRLAQVQLGGRVLALHIQIPGLPVLGKRWCGAVLGYVDQAVEALSRHGEHRNYNTSDAVTEVTWTRNHLLRTDFTSLSWHLQLRRPWGEMGVTVG